MRNEERKKERKKASDLLTYALLDNHSLRMKYRDNIDAGRDGT